MLRVAAFIAVILVAVAPPAAGKVYKWVMPDGSIQYSDRPQEEGAEQVDLPPLQLYTAPPTPATSQAEDAEEKDEEAVARGYDKVEFVKPTPGEVIRDNGGIVQVQLKLEPALQTGHSVEILLDGKSVGSGRATSASLSNVDRGSHSVSAVIKDDKGSTVASAPAVSFELKRVSRLLPARPAPKAGGS